MWAPWWYRPFLSQPHSSSSSLSTGVSTTESADMLPCSSMHLAHVHGGISAVPCPYVAVRFLTISCEEGKHVKANKAECMKCAASILENMGWCTACLLEDGRASRLSALEVD